MRSARRRSRQKIHFGLTLLSGVPDATKASRADLAAEVGILDNPTLRRIEAFDAVPPTVQRHAAAVRDAHERASVEFFVGEDGVPSARLRQGVDPPAEVGR